MTRLYHALLLLLSSVGTVGYAETQLPQIDDMLADFYRDSVTFMNQQPPKVDSRGRVRHDPRFSTEAQSQGDDLRLRDRTRAVILDRREPASAETPEMRRLGVTSILSGYLPDDDPANLVDNDAEMLLTLEDIIAANLESAALPEQPWSGDYWAIYKGNLGARYADTEFPGAVDWKENHEFSLARPAADIIASGDAEAINRLSPSEKYEAIVGDTEHLLTQAMWREGEYYYDKFGEVETWFGICHGWAPAAYVMNRPKQSVTVPMAHTDLGVTFYPDDLKGLASLLWATAAPRSRAIGGRCNDKEPKLDENGRVLDGPCFDTNPGAWHLAVVNQIGMSQRSAIIDASFDYEVWNQPLVRYKYSYFNPQSANHVATLAEAKLPIADFTKDKFKAYRDPRATHVVGIAMDVTYTIETRATTQATNAPEEDAMRTVRYLYDLELSADGQVIGGEWYINRHPDFIWTPAKGRRAQTYYDFAATGAWTEEGARVPETWRMPAKAASQQGQPLAKIVERLIELAQ